MAHFYGRVNGARGNASRLGYMSTGIKTVAASYSGAIETRLWYSQKHQRDRYQVVLLDWPSGDVREVIAEGFLAVEGAGPPSQARG